MAKGQYSRQDSFDFYHYYHHYLYLLHMLSSCHTGSTVLGLVVETVHQGGGTANDSFRSCMKGRILFYHCYSGFMGFPCGSAGKEFLCNVGDLSSIPRLERSPGKGNIYPLQYSWAFLVAQMVKNLPSMWDTWVWSLGWKDPLEKGKASHSSIMAWRIS